MRSRVLHLSTTLTLYRDARGTVLGLIGISRDLTRQKQAEQEQRRLRQALEDQRLELEAQNELLTEARLAQELSSQRYLEPSNLTVPSLKR
jgi:signal transduction histidine kinase